MKLKQGMYKFIETKKTAIKKEKKKEEERNNLPMNSKKVSTKKPDISKK